MIYPRSILECIPYYSDRDKALLQLQVVVSVNFSMIEVSLSVSYKIGFTMISPLQVIH